MRTFKIPKGADKLSNLVCHSLANMDPEEYFLELQKIANNEKFDMRVRAQAQVMVDRIKAEKDLTNTK